MSPERAWRSFGDVRRLTLRRGFVIVSLAGTGVVAEIAAQAPLPAPRDTSNRRVLDTVAVRGRSADLIGTARSASEGHVGRNELRARPTAREGELLEAIPGMIVTQHSGDGKANQYFVRGFNLDHGTDFQTRVEGMPVNMPTHGHGQGYTDLSFLIPEVVERLDYSLGVYSGERGDFASAGGVDLYLARRLRPFARVDAGANGLARLVTGGARRVGAGMLLGAFELKSYDGPWELSQDLRKRSGLLRFSSDRGASQFSVLAMAYDNRWNASDQVPRRAVDAGLISRFGQIDSTNGGVSARYSLSGSWRRAGTRSVQEAQGFVVASDLSLFSNFAYFLENATDGDQFEQVDRRRVFGGHVTHMQSAIAFGASHVLKTGLQVRTDVIDQVGLYQTRARVRSRTVREDHVRETGAGLFAEAESRWNSRIRSIVALRGDGYAFGVHSDQPGNSGSRVAAIISPKATIIANASPTAELYLSAGHGFHSNDARGTTITRNPATNEPASPVDPLVRSRGAEFGARATPVAGWRSTMALWALDLDSELLFVGDAGATEPAAGSSRQGATWTNFYRPIASLAFDVDISLARARFRGMPVGGDRIPGALERVLAAGAAWSPPATGAFGAVRLRHFGSYPLIEDNSVRADATALVNAEAGYRWPGRVRLTATLLNVLNSAAADIQYYYASRLSGELAGIDDVHFHPVEPRQIRISLERQF